MRYGFGILALALLPIVAVHVLIVIAVGLFMVVAGTFALADGQAVLIGVVLLALSLMLLRACWWMFQQRRTMLRAHRTALGGTCIVVALMAWLLAPADPLMGKAVVSMAIVYGLFGASLAVSAWEDRRSP